MRKKLLLFTVCLLAAVSMAIAQTSKTVTGVVTSSEDN